MTVTVKHASLTGAAANPDVLVDGPKWDAEHSIEGLPDGDLVGTTDAQVLTNKTISGANNTLTVRESDLSLLDNTTADVTTGRHGFVPKLPNDASKFLDGTGAFTTPVAGSGDVTGPSSSVDGEIALYNSTTGKVIKRATTTGLLKASSGVLAAAISGADYAPATSGSAILKGNGSGGFSSATAGVDYYNPGGTDVAVVDGGTGASTAAGARTNLGSTTVGDAVFIAANAAAARTAIGAGTISTQNSNAVTVTGGTISGLTSLGVSGTVTVGPTGSTTDKGIAITQTPHGTSTSSTYYPYNSIVISSDDADTDGLTGGNQAFSVTHNFGGSSMKGSRIGSYTRVNLVSPSSSSNLAKEYVGVSGYSVAASADGGTDTGSGAKGSFFGANFVAATNASITNLLGVIGGEVNIVVRTGSTTQRKVGWAIVGGAEDAVQGATWDAALVISNQTGSTAGWTDGILVGNTNGQFPIASGGTILRATSGSVTRGIDFNSVTFSGTAFRSPGFNVGPTGNVNLGTAGSAVGAASFANATSGSITLQPVTGALGSSVLSLPAKTGVVSLRQDAYKNLGSAATTAVTTIEDLMTYTIPANTLRTNQRVRIIAWGTTAANANSKTVRLHFGGTSIGGTLPTNATPWRLEGNVYITGSNTQKYERTGSAQGIAMSVGNGSLTETDTSNIVVKVSGQNGTASAGDITCLGFTVEILD